MVGHYLIQFRNGMR